MMDSYFQDISEFLPSESLLHKIDSSIDVPAGWVGTNESVFVEELMNDLLQKYSFNDILVHFSEFEEPADDTENTSSDSINRDLFRFQLTGWFYYVTDNIFSKYYSYRLVNGSPSRLANEIINYIYLEYFFEDKATNLTMLIRNLRKSSLVGLAEDAVPSVSEINDFMKIYNWTQDEALSLNVDILWTFSKEWDADKFLDVVSHSNFNLRKAEKLFKLGISSLEELYQLIVVSDVYLPDSELDSMLEAIQE